METDNPFDIVWLYSLYPIFPFRYFVPFNLFLIGLDLQFITINVICN